ncbi:hypothetical protein SDJN03_01870, partial [Cucurbita argyrosperma subsp. sororia]
MRMLCPNVDHENGLDTVLEVPIPEEMFTNMGTNAALRWRNLRALMKAQSAANTNVNNGKSSSHLSAASNNEFMALLKLVSTPLIPFQVHLDLTFNFSIRDYSIEASTAKYIVHQYVAAAGGQAALNSVNSMYAVGQVKMLGSAMQQGEDSVQMKGKCEVGGFVLWQKNPDLWYLELVVSGYKISAGSDGKVAWNQSSSQPSHANKGPPRPLRRFFQGLDPRHTANLFECAVCIGERTVNQEDCFILKLETASELLRSQSTSHVEIVHHTIWGYFSQRTGLLIQFEDTKLIKMKAGKRNEVFWETSIASTIEDYQYVDNINIAHSGRTTARLHRYGETLNHRRKIEENWRIEEVDFNICGLSMDSFLPPAEMKRDPSNTGEREAGEN